MNAIYISAVFDHYMENWETSVRNNKAWVKYPGGYQMNSKNGFTLKMSFSQNLSVSIYECFKQTEKGNRISDLGSFQFEHGWKTMWGKQNLFPSEVSILTKEDCRNFLLESNWKVSQKKDVLKHPEYQITYEHDNDGGLNYFTTSRAGSVQHFLELLFSAGIPIDHRYIKNVG